jgi:hypothetical protein
MKNNLNIIFKRVFKITLFLFILFLLTKLFTNNINATWCGNCEICRCVQQGTDLCQALGWGPICFITFVDHAYNPIWYEPPQQCGWGVDCSTCPYLSGGVQVSCGRNMTELWWFGPSCGCSGGGGGGGGYSISLRLLADLNDNGINDEGAPNCQWERQQPWVTNYNWWNAHPAGWGGQYLMSLPLDNPNFRCSNYILSSEKYNICSVYNNFPVNKSPITINVYNPFDQTTSQTTYPGDWSCSVSGACDCGPVWGVGIKWSRTSHENPYIISPKFGENWRIERILACTGNGQPRCELQPDGTLYVYNLSDGASTGMDLLIHVDASPTPTPTPTPIPGPWWQVSDADVSTNGDLTSLIPDTCTLPVCNPVFGLVGDGGFPGVPAFGGTANFNLGAGTGMAAEDPYNWSANTQSSFRKTYNYAFFKSQLPADIIPTEINSSVDPSCVPGGGCTVNGGFFDSGGTASRGYIWYHFDGETLDTLTINGDVTLAGDRKVVLLVEGGDLNIGGRINISSPGEGFFMTVVGKNGSGGRGNILIDPSVSHLTEAVVEGIFLAEGEIRTGTNGVDLDGRLYLRGSYAAYGGMVLERDLADDSVTPAELVEYAPEIIAAFPRVFTTRRMSWKEVAP